MDNKRNLFISLPPMSFVKRMKRMIYELFEEYDIIEKEEKNTCEVLFFLTRLRHDYVDLFNEIYDACELNKKMVYMKKGKHFKPFLSRLVISSGRITIRKPEYNHATCELEHKEHDMRLLDKIHKKSMEHMIGKALGVIVEKRFYGAKRIVILCDVWPEENMLVEEAKKYGIETICCQHALFSEDETFSTINALNYYDLKCDEYLVWGEATAGLYKKYNPAAKVVVCGNPIIKDEPTRKIDDNIFGVVFDIPANHDYNQRMLDIATNVARKMNKKVYVRMHPIDKKKFGSESYLYDEKIVSFDDNTDIACVIVGHTSTMMCNYLLKGYKTLKYRSNEPCYLKNEEIQFDSEEELEKLITDDTIVFDGIGNEHITYRGQESKKMYQSSFNIVWRGQYAE